MDAMKAARGAAGWAPGNRTPAEIEAIRRDYEAGADSVRVVCQTHGIAEKDLYAMAAAGGWPGRSHVKTIGAVADAKRRAEIGKAVADARERELWGEHREDVYFLRRRGFGVTRDGDAFVVGNVRCTAGELIDKAARERRLAAPPAPIDAPPARRVGARSRATP